MSDKEKVINSIIELVKECSDLELLYLIQGLLITPEN